MYTASHHARERPLTITSPLGDKHLDKEWKFLCACASPLPVPAAALSRSQANLDWDLVLELAEGHRVLGVLAARLKETDYADVPAEAREKLQGRMRAQHLFSLSMTAELFRILEQFAKAGVESLLVKGPVVSVLAYGDPAIRSYVDLDLLVRSEAILLASQIMAALEFDADVPEAAIRAGKIPGEYLFSRPGTRQMIELHTEKTFRYYPQPMRVEDLFARQRRVLVHGKEIPALSLEDEFVLNCIHGAKHFWERLMWPADVAAIVVRHPELDWRRAQTAAADVGAERLLCVALLLSESLLGVAVPAEMAGAVNADNSAKALVRQIKGWLPYAGYMAPPLFQRAVFRWRMGGGRNGGTGYLLRLSLSTTEDDWAEGQKGSRLWEILRRPIRLIRKYGQGG